MGWDSERNSSGIWKFSISNPQEFSRILLYLNLITVFESKISLLALYIHIFESRLDNNSNSFSSVVHAECLGLCTVCNCAVHKRCHDKILGQCPGTAKDSRETQMLTERFNIDVPHRFVDHKFISPAFCDHCGSMIFGFVRPELQCSGISYLTYLHSEMLSHMTLCNCDDCV